MTIHYLGHSSFLLVSDAGTRIVTDPYGDIGYAFPHVSADCVTVSHGHYDHAEVSAVAGTPRILSSAGDFRVGDVAIAAFPCWHDDAGGRKRGPNLAFRFTADGVTVCHLGDIGEACNAAFVQRLGHIDVLLVPVGGVYTVDAAGAKAYVDAIRPACTVPMHYKTEDLKIGIGGVGPFLAQFPEEQISKLGGPLKAENALGGKIIVMERMK